MQTGRLLIDDGIYSSSLKALYFVSKRTGGWVWKMTIFADVQYSIISDIVGEGVGGSEEAHKNVDVI